VIALSVLFAALFFGNALATLYTFYLKWKKNRNRKNVKEE
jgi:hypothetical protein